MKLSDLSYYCIKNAAFNDDYSFTKKSYLENKFNGSPEYSIATNNVFLAINEAIARLSDLERIPYRIARCNVDINGIIDFKNNPISENNRTIYVKEIIGIASNYNEKTYSFRPVGLDKVYVDKARNCSVLVEFKEDIPLFTREDIPYPSVIGELTGNDIELRDYNINSSMTNYIAEYVMGRILEQVAPDLASMHITRAEQYFSNISIVMKSLNQRVVENAITIE